MLLSSGLSREVAVVVAHLVLFSQLGVLTRIGLDALFSNGCSTSGGGGGKKFGTCLTSLGEFSPFFCPSKKPRFPFPAPLAPLSATHPRTRPSHLPCPPPPFVRTTGLGSDPFGAYFPDLPSNALGSFVMGLAAASSTLSLGAPKPLAALPASHPWQRSPELHIGVRTGFCGCLTTFSAWSAALLAQAVGGGGRPGGRWPQWLWGWAVGLLVALGSYAAGEHAARLLDDRLRPREERAQARRDAAAARLAVEAAPSIGVPWSGVVARDGVEGGGGGGLLSPSSSSWAAAARRRGGGGGSWGLGGGGAGDEEAPAAAAAAAAALDAPARAAAKALASLGEVSLPLSAVARHHASRAVASLARRSAVLEELASMRREADLGAAAERAQRQRQQQQQRLPEGRFDEGEEAAAAAAAAAEEAVRETARAAAAVARAEAAAAAAAAAEAEAEGAEDKDLEGGPAAAAADAPFRSTAAATATSADAATAPASSGDRLGRWRQRKRNHGQHKARAAAEEEEQAADGARAAAAASLSTRRSSASAASWRLPPPRARSPDAGTTREVCMPLSTLAEKVREEAAAAARAAPPSSSTSSSSSSSLPSPPAAAAALQRRPLAARATSLLRRGYRSAARAAEGGSDAEANLSSYSFATRTNAAAVLLSLALWVTFLLLFVLDEAEGTTASRRGEWLAVVLAPLGCLLRWRLATLNYSLAGRWRFLPAGTLAANLGGCALTFAVAAMLERRPPSSVWGAAVAKALQVGVAGSLSTVSTLSAEVTAQLRRAPADARGYVYLGLTWLSAQAIGVLVYGSAVWSKP